MSIDRFVAGRPDQRLIEPVLPPKGLPAVKLPDTGWNLLAGDLPLPCAVLKESALAANSAGMRAFLDRAGAVLCPHGKTTMSPELMHRQLADGAWGITAATWHQVRVMHHFGIRRVLMANQLIGAAAIDGVSAILEHDAGFDFLCLVDSIEAVAHLDSLLRLPPGRRVSVLLELGQNGARTGARRIGTALEVARAVRSSASLQLRGVETYEGIIQGDDDVSVEASIDRLYGFTIDAARACLAERLFESDTIIMSGGGSLFYDMAARGLGMAALGVPTQIVLRSGCYLTYDDRWQATAISRMATRAPELMAGIQPRPAIELWAHVQSRPEPGLAFATLGKRDVSFDIDLPMPKFWFRPGYHKEVQALDDHQVTGLNDQHAYLRLPTSSPVAVGDLIGFGISHPCTTFDKWRSIPIVDDAYGVTSIINTYF